MTAAVDPAPPAATSAGAAPAPRAVSAAIEPSAGTPATDVGPRAKLASNGLAPPEASSGAAPPALSAPEARSPHHYRVAAIGDSLTDPRSHGGGYLSYVKTRCPKLEIDNFGKGATMVNQMRKRFDAEVAQSPKQYTHLIVFGGVNDLYSDLTAFRTPAKIERDLDYMYEWGHDHGVQVIALTVAPWGGFKRYFNPSRAAATREVNAWIRAQPEKGTVSHVVDAYALLSCGDPESLCDRFFVPFKDGIHFGPEGHQVLGEALFRSAFSDCD